MNGLSGSGSSKGGNQLMTSHSRADSGNVSAEIPGILRDPVIASARKMNTEIPDILPHEKVFPIQIGSDLFRLSGASISSDAPSYFSEYFKCQLKQAEENGENNHSIRTLYIDRDPVTFKDISLHLQGYHVAPRDASHFVKLFADAQFYSLPRLISQLYEESIFITIGHRDFQIPRELFSDPGNSPNYFSLGFAVFFSTPTEIFPGLNREGLLRPPSIMPPSVASRSAETFAELLHLLRGYPVHIRSEDHRAELLRDCRYFLFKGLEQKLIRHEITYNLVRRRSEITLRLEDVRPSGISIVSFPSVSSSSSPSPESGPATPVYNAHQVSLAYVNYARPFVDSQSYELVLEIGEECTRLHLSTMQCEFVGDGKARIARLFEVISTKLNLPTCQPLGLWMKHGGASSQPASPGNTPISNDWVRCVVGEEAYVQLDGREYRGHVHGGLGAYATELDLRGGRSGSNASSVSGIEENFGEPSRKRRRLEKEESWVIKTGQWRLKIQSSANLKGGVECLMVAVRLDAVSGEFGRNAQRGFLGS